MESKTSYTVMSLPITSLQRNEEPLILDEIVRVRADNDVSEDRLREMMQARQDRIVRWMYEQLGNGRLVVVVGDRERVYEGKTTVERLGDPCWRRETINQSEYYRLVSELVVR